ncbi:unnamed protein product [Rotaria socialis]|uniref:Uncharacterized protein n=1 Tax=Rotaria socialis TaxID=392032 RepID=A0A817LXD1_9BILA|nr:unnamed protein product [Rotaria socialis]CAF3370736.1 unnamed protein product [Rotaria socialis]CAF3376754.1 unnamed protein product [Rotaria socialis]CAF3406087.1 unnamed protein product [Rotaria socialis]CAF3523586.1 unnamed protein product [Rotaria socialis]
MKSWHQCLSILVVFIFYVLSAEAHPLSYAQEQRSFLLCHLSPVSCKRSLSNTEEIENLLTMNIEDALSICTALNKPLWNCFNNHYTLK